MQIIQQIAWSSFSQWEKSYYEDPKGLRLGQAFLCHFFPGHKDPLLFYTKDYKLAEDRIWEFYINFEL